MNVLFDIIHPAHVHLFKNFVKYLKENKHQVIVTSRAKDVTNELLNHYGIEHIPITKPSPKGIKLFTEQLIRDCKIIVLNHKYKFDFAYGTSASIGLLSLLGKTSSLVFNEDDDSSQPVFCLKSYPFASEIWMPEKTTHYKWLKKRKFYNSYHELAYLHPDNFAPNEKIPESYGLERGKYILVRHSALDAHHDIGVTGLRGRIWECVSEIIKDYPKIESKEKEKSHQIKPWDMHHVLAFAKLVISDSQTMTAEAAVLGIPSIRYNSFVGKLYYLDELEEKYQLTFGFRPNEEEKLLKKLKELLEEKNSEKIFKAAKDKMLKDKIDLNKFIIDSFEERQQKK